MITLKVKSGIEKIFSDFGFPLESSYNGRNQYNYVCKKFNITITIFDSNPILISINFTKFDGEIKIFSCYQENLESTLVDLNICIENDVIDNDEFKEQSKLVDFLKKYMKISGDLSGTSMNIQLRIGGELISENVIDLYDLPVDFHRNGQEE